jgi:hypothetical protein
MGGRGGDWRIVFGNNFPRVWPEVHDNSFPSIVTGRNNIRRHRQTATLLGRRRFPDSHLQSYLLPCPSPDCDFIMLRLAATGQFLSGFCFPGVALSGIWPSGFVFISPGVNVRRPSGGGKAVPAPFRL